MGLVEVDVIYELEFTVREEDVGHLAEFLLKVDLLNRLWNMIV
jgi:hypothetical protein